MKNCSKLNFEIFSRSSEYLVVALAPMNLPIDRLPHYKTTEFEKLSTLLVNPGNCNFYRDCFPEVSELIRRAMKETGATRLVFCGSSMGAYGALLFGSVFEETAYVVAYSPFLRLDHIGSLSQLAMDPNLLVEEYRHFVALQNRLKKISAKVFLFHPCIDRQDGAHIADAEQFGDCEHITRYHLFCSHDIHSHIALPKVVSSLIRYGDVPSAEIEPLRAPAEEVRITKQVYQLYSEEVRRGQTDFDLPLMPVENTKNWIYFYWKGRNLSRHGRRWEGLSNFMTALAYGGSKFAETHFCVANVLKDLGHIHAAIGHYQEAFKIDPTNAATSKIICQLSTK